MNWVVSKTELAALLDKYFVGATDADVTALYLELERLDADDAEMTERIIHFNVGSLGYRSYGLAWREELSFDKPLPDPMDIAAYVANGMKNFPQARPYCPPAYVGTWKQRDTDFAWRFDADGTFATDEPARAKNVKWRVHRDPSWRDSIWLTPKNDITRFPLVVASQSDTELHLHDLADMFPQIDYHLVRA